MMIITLTGPMACGKTLTREIVEKHKAEIEGKTGHKILVKEELDQKLTTNEELVYPVFRVMRFKASGKWMDTFYVHLLVENMRDAAKLLPQLHPVPKGGSMVVVEAITPAAEQFFYPIEVKA